MKPRKVFSIAYVGHREGRRLSRNAQCIHDDCCNILKQIKDAATEAFDAPDVKKLFHREPLEIAAIGGVTEGADSIFLQALSEYKIPSSKIFSENVQMELYSQANTHDVRSTFFLDFTGRFKAHEQLIQSRSDILIAVWDGKEKQGETGGTVRAIHNALNFGIPVFWVNATENKEPVLMTIGVGEPEKDLEKILDCTFDCQPCAEVDLKVVIRKSIKPKGSVCQNKAFHRYLSGYSEWPMMNWLWDKAYRLSRFDLKKVFSIQATTRVVAKNDIEQHLANAERVSTHMANRYRVSVLGLYLLSAFAVFWAAAGYVFEENFHHFSEEYLYGIYLSGWAEIAVILIIIFWFIWGDWRQWHGLWIHSRHLSEMLRMHQLLDPVAGVASFMLKQDSVQMNWAHWLYRRYAIASLQLKKNTQPVNINNDCTQDYNETLKSYLNDQISYHQQKAESEEMRHKFLHYGGYTLFGLTLLAALSHLLHIGGHELASWLTLTTIVFPAFGAAFHAILVQEEVERLIHTSKEINRQLEKIQQHLSVSDIALLRKQSMDAADLMAAEASSWQQMVGFKKLELPA